MDTVKELIEALQKLDPRLPVKIRRWEGNDIGQGEYSYHNFWEPQVEEVDGEVIVTIEV